MSDAVHTAVGTAYGDDKGGQSGQTTGPRNSASRVLAASLIGTTIEFFDFYIYAMAAVLIFPKLFFPADNETVSTLISLGSFALAFFARPIGGIVFGHYGDRLGRKATLVAALLTMGLSTVAIGLLPTYAQIGIVAPLLLSLCRIGQGLGLGGEWGGAVLLATENAPPGKRTRYAMFPQLGAPIGFILAGGSFLLLGAVLDQDQLFGWGWRLPFLFSLVLVIFGLWMRLKIVETPEFAAAVEKQERVRLPVGNVLASHKKATVVGTCAALTTFVLFYLMTVFALNYGTKELGFTRNEFLIMQLIATVFFGLTIPLSGFLSDRYGRRRVLLLTTVGIGIFGLIMAPLVQLGMAGVLVFLVLGLALMGMTYGPIGAALAGLYPTHLRYTGASLTFNLAGIFGASLAPTVATWLAANFGFYSVGVYLTLAALITFVALKASGDLDK